MLFSSIPFLFYFLPCVFVLYFLVPMRWKNTMLLLASLFFYAWGEPKFVVFIPGGPQARKALSDALARVQSGTSGLLQVRGLLPLRL